MAVLRDWRERRFLARQDGSWLRTIATMTVRLGESDPTSLLARTDQIVDRLAVLTTSGSARYPSLSKEQQALVISRAYIDEVIDSGEEPADWVADCVELRRIGYRLYAEGGEGWMAAVAERARTVRGVSIRLVEMYWDGIGRWQH